MCFTATYPYWQGNTIIMIQVSHSEVRMVQYHKKFTLEFQSDTCFCLNQSVKSSVKPACVNYVSA